MHSENGRVIGNIRPKTEADPRQLVLLTPQGALMELRFTKKPADPAAAEVGVVKPRNVYTCTLEAVPFKLSGDIEADNAGQAVLHLLGCEDSQKLLTAWASRVEDYQPSALVKLT